MLKAVKDYFYLACAVNHPVLWIMHVACIITYAWWLYGAVTFFLAGFYIGAAILVALVIGFVFSFWTQGKSAREEDEARENKS